MITPKHEVTVFNLLPPNAGSSGNHYGYGIGGLERMRNTMRKESVDLDHEQTAQNIKQPDLIGQVHLQQMQQNGMVQSDMQNQFGLPFLSFQNQSI